MSLKTDFTTIRNLRYGRSPRLDAWLLHFMTENNLDSSIDPDKNASREQIRFMVVLDDEEQVYGPFSDRRLPLLLSGHQTDEVRAEYNEKWCALTQLVRTYVPDQDMRKRILLLCSHKYRQIQTSPIIIPSRLMKRFITIFLALSGHDDPYRMTKRRFNRQAQEALDSPELDRMLNVCPDQATQCIRLSDFRFNLDMIELIRLLILSTWSEIWTEAYYQAACDRITDKDLYNAQALEAVSKAFAGTPDYQHKILYLPDTSGGLMFDLLIIKALLRQGHRITLVLKEGFYFEAPTFWDRDLDPELEEALSEAFFLEDNDISKNRLLQVQREHPFVVISDGTREELNLYRTSTTFARAWKEADLIIAKGEPNHRRLIKTSQQFTRDIICFHRDEAGKFQLHVKPKPTDIVQFSEAELRDKADEIIAEMRKASGQGKTIMFYSAIIGSIPGQTKTATKVVDTFVNHLRQKLDAVFIINPAEHFEEGMDADDLMFMWERVQRSGLINVWRFQSVADIERSFELMGSKVPPTWAGKDATFSTGCTKEMHIAVDVQKKNPEMQISGPSPERFFRRNEYGVGRFSDVVLS